MNPALEMPTIAREGAREVCLAELTYESTVRNIRNDISEVRSVTNSRGLIRTSDFFGNTRTSANTRNYKVVRPGMFAYNPSRVNVGSIGWLDETEPVIVSPMYVVFGIDTTRLIPEFLSLFLASRSGRREIEGRTEVGARFRLTYESMSQIRVPLPTIDAQRRIVNFLSKFTDLEVEMKAELEARRRQLAYYRELLIAELDPAETRWAPMSEVGDFVRGRRFIKTDYAPTGIPSIHYGEIYTSYGTSAVSTISHLRDDMASQLRYAQPSDVIIAAVGETAEDVGKGLAWLGSHAVAIHDDCFIYRHPLDAKFVSYFLQTTAFHAQKVKFVTQAKMKRLSKEGLGKVLIPIPTMEEQKRITSLLDKFDALVNDENFGIPAELSARRKQYEYYRDRLLTFEKESA